MLYTEIENTIKTFDFKQITEERKSVLQPLVDFIQSKVNSRQEIRLNLICTHNSRRSHMSQVWAQTAAAYYNIKNVSCYSGGTEATALFPMVAETLQYSGFKVKAISEGNNPVYSIKFSANEFPVIGFSKTYDDDFNPESEFAAIMTCSQADGGCPFIAGAEKRIPITFEDPKVSDGTPQQKQIYQERSLQIGTEMFYVFSKIKQ
ncbi:MAG: protein-tyrosine-phosphatase [Flavobacterium lindanitolerans]|jgi:arsenate reductase (thioredoxin)|uniref:Protein-tyrosine-phosphatase n=1 Tax=Flavobacterium microcysteis TaxID=2596891 RepID=A0A501PZV6_9FLAO|nr:MULTISPECIES: protein-tyrosine-phosphatase [Flavobacterium]MBL7869773.1 protein-tyrosine-phosphatase [Flavobacterium lindanitolerans]MDL2143496.1 protein-tyrosine-phosphatase [Flavobacterium tructae]TPD65953.1 protein-tyrosine-phosphatase [Flavobacterium microcysteis]